MEYFWIAVAAYFGWLAAPFILVFGIIMLLVVAWLGLMFLYKVEGAFRSIKRRIWK